MDRATAMQIWREVCGSDGVMGLPATGRLLEKFATQIEDRAREAAPKNTPPLLYAFADKNGELELRGPFVLATEREGQALRMSDVRDGKDIYCYAYVGKWSMQMRDRWLRERSAR